MTDVAPASAAAPAKTKKASKPKAPSAHPKYSEMIAAAVKALKERNGSSRQAILKYITANYKLGQNQNSIASHLKQALKKGVSSGQLKQSKGTGAAGSFKMGEDAKKNAKKAAKPKAAKPKAKSPKKAAKKPAAKKTDKTKKPKAKKPAAKKAKTPKKAAASKAKKTTKSPKKTKTASKSKTQKKTPKKAARK